MNKLESFNLIEKFLIFKFNNKSKIISKGKKNLKEKPKTNKIIKKIK